MEVFYRQVEDYEQRAGLLKGGRKLFKEQGEDDQKLSNRRTACRPQGGRAKLRESGARGRPHRLLLCTAVSELGIKAPAALVAIQAVRGGRPGGRDGPCRCGSRAPRVRQLRFERGAGLRAGAFLR